MFIRNISHNYASREQIVLVLNNGNNSKNFTIGNSNDDLSLSFLLSILNNHRDKDTFKSTLANIIYQNLNNKEKEIIDYLKNNDNSLIDMKVVLQEVKEDGNLSCNKKDYTQEYLNELKELEALDFKIRETKKYYRKMDKISGILPMNELIEETNGTNTKLSNIHITDIERLNSYKFHTSLINQ